LPSKFPFACSAAICRGVAGCDHIREFEEVREEPPPARPDDVRLDPVRRFEVPFVMIAPG
jgi:hypothetical protein